MISFLLFSVLFFRSLLLRAFEHLLGVRFSFLEGFELLISWLSLFVLVFIRYPPLRLPFAWWSLLFL